MLNRALILGLLVSHKDDAGAAADAIVRALPKLDMSEKEIEDMIAENKAMKDEIGKCKAEMAEMEKEKEKKGDAALTLADRRAAALDRAALEAAAAKAKIDKADTLEDAALRRAVVQALRGDAIPADAPDAVILAHWQILRADATRSDADGAAGWSARNDEAPRRTVTRLSPLDAALAGVKLST